VAGIESKIFGKRRSEGGGIFERS